MLGSLGLLHSVTLCAGSMFWGKGPRGLLKRGGNLERYYTGIRRRGRETDRQTDRQTETQRAHNCS